LKRGTKREAHLEHWRLGKRAARRPRRRRTWNRHLRRGLPGLRVQRVHVRASILGRGGNYTEPVQRATRVRDKWGAWTGDENLPEVIEQTMHSTANAWRNVLVGTAVGRKKTNFMVVVLCGTNARCGFWKRKSGMRAPARRINNSMKRTVVTR